MNSAAPHPQRIGVLGASPAAQRLIKHIVDSPESELVVVADSDIETLREITDRYPGVRVTADFTKVLAARSLDALYIATPTVTHTELVETALRSGKHVLVEQPITRSADDAQQLAEVSQDSGGVLMIARPSLYSESVLKVNDLIRNEEIGDAHYFTSEHTVLGAPQAGALWALAPDDIATLLFWADELPVSVEASGRSLINGGSDEALILNLRFGSGTIAEIQLATFASKETHRLTLAGRKGTVVCDELATSEAIKLHHQIAVGDPNNQTAGPISIPQVNPSNALANEWEHFLYCIRYGQKPRSSARTGVWIVAILEAIERSLHSTRRETIQFPRATTRARTANMRETEDSRQ